MGEKMVPFVGSRELEFDSVEVHRRSPKKGEGTYFERTLSSMKDDWKHMTVLIYEIFEDVPAKNLQGYGIDNFEISLGFDAKGKLAFIAEGGIQATIKLTLKKTSIRELEN